MLTTMRLKTKDMMAQASISSEGSKAGPGRHRQRRSGCCDEELDARQDLLKSEVVAVEGEEELGKD